jgi:hypothetical protein
MLPMRAKELQREMTQAQSSKSYRPSGGYWHYLEIVARVGCVHADRRSALFAVCLC